jgi:hypothetical protein
LKDSNLCQLRIALGDCVFNLLLDIRPIWNGSGCFGLLQDLRTFLAPLDSNLKALYVVLDRVGNSGRKQLSLLALLLIAQFGYRKIRKNGDDGEYYHQHT